MKLQYEISTIATAIAMNPTQEEKFKFTRG